MKMPTQSNSELHHHFLDAVLLLLLPTLASARLPAAACPLPASPPACSLLPVCLPSQADADQVAVRFIKQEGKQEVNKDCAPVQRIISRRDANGLIAAAAAALEVLTPFSPESLPHR